MSRLDSFIRRLEAQRACLDWAAGEIASVPGLILELGLGNGRTFDHLRCALPGRRIIVFERDPKPHPACMPEEADLMVGDFTVTLRDAIAHLGPTAALIHGDVGTGDSARNQRLAKLLAPLAIRLLHPRGIIVTDQELQGTDLITVTPPHGITANRYFLYRHQS